MSKSGSLNAESCDFISWNHSEDGCSPENSAFAGVSASSEYFEVVAIVLKHELRVNGYQQFNCFNILNWKLLRLRVLFLHTTYTSFLRQDRHAIGRGVSFKGLSALFRIIERLFNNSCKSAEVTFNS